MPLWWAVLDVTMPLGVVPMNPCLGLLTEQMLRTPSGTFVRPLDRTNREENFHAPKEALKKSAR